MFRINEGRKKNEFAGKNIAYRYNIKCYVDFEQKRYWLG